MHDLRGLDNAIEGRAVAGIEIEVHVVRPVDVVAGGVPLIQIDAAEIDHPHQRGEILDHREQDDALRSVIDLADLDPRGARLRRALHEEEFARGAVRIALHHHRTVADVRQQHGAMSA